MISKQRFHFIKNNKNAGINSKNNFKPTMFDPLSLSAEMLSLKRTTPLLLFNLTAPE